MTTYLNLKELKLKATSYWNNTEHCSLFTWNTIIEPIAEGIIKGKINKPFEHGPVPIGGMLVDAGLGALNLTNLTIYIEYHWLAF